MIQFLTSSPFLFHHDPATLNPDNEFVERLSIVLRGRPRTLIICSDPKDHNGTKEFAGVIRDSFARAGIHLGKISILGGRTAWLAHHLVAASDFIVIMGGHVPTQNAWFQKINLRKHMKHFDGVLMTISAGSMNCADTVYSQPEEPGESRPEFQRFRSGLGLTKYNILPHYQEVYDRELDGQMLYDDITAADSMGNEFLVFPDGTYIFRDHEEHAILGECYLMHDGEMEQISELGGRVELD